MLYQACPLVAGLSSLSIVTGLNNLPNRDCSIQFFLRNCFGQPVYSDRSVQPVLQRLFCPTCPKEPVHSDWPVQTVL
jgi:hypothetical protein